MNLLNQLTASTFKRLNEDLDVAVTTEVTDRDGNLMEPPHLRIELPRITGMEYDSDDKIYQVDHTMNAFSSASNVDEVNQIIWGAIASLTGEPLLIDGYTTHITRIERTVPIRQMEKGKEVKQQALELRYWIS